MRLRGFDPAIDKSREATMKRIVPAVFVAMGVLAALPARAETPEEWVKLGARVHGGFGSFVPVGVRIGLDALERLGAKPREVTVTYYDSDRAPCACVADGVALATIASVGQRSLQVAAEKAPAGQMAAIVIRHKQTGAAVRYGIAESWLPKLVEMNKQLNELGRYEAVMKADGLFDVTVEK
jgi:formylmethanofuran dehydrogenase subunit E